MEAGIKGLIGMSAGDAEVILRDFRRIFGDSPDEMLDGPDRLLCHAERQNFQPDQFPRHKALLDLAARLSASATKEALALALVYRSPGLVVYAKDNAEFITELTEVAAACRQLVDGYAALLKVVEYRAKLAEVPRPSKPKRRGA